VSGVPHALYSEALLAHMDKCDGCSLVTSQLCPIGRKLLDAYALRAAQLMAPIPVMLPRSGNKA
jgi:hypothetical protein